MSKNPGWHLQEAPGSMVFPPGYIGETWELSGVSDMVGF